MAYRCPVLHRQYKKALPKPCAKCPFTKAAVRGRLSHDPKIKAEALNVSTVLSAARGSGFRCHAVYEVSGHQLVIPCRGAQLYKQNSKEVFNQEEFYDHHLEA